MSQRSRILTTYEFGPSTPPPLPSQYPQEVHQKAPISDQGYARSLDPGLHLHRQKLESIDLSARKLPRTLKEVELRYINVGGGGMYFDNINLQRPTAGDDTRCLDGGSEEHPSASRDLVELR